jgi:hypothetical protein
VIVLQPWTAPVSTPNRIDVDVCGVFQSAIVASVQCTAVDTLGHLAGRWQVQVSPAVESGRWVMHLRGAFGHHVASFAAAPPQLAATVQRSLLAFIKGMVPPIAVTRRAGLRVVWSRPSAPLSFKVPVPEAAPDVHSHDGVAPRRRAR